MEVKQLVYDLTCVGGLALVGHYPEALGPLWAALPVRVGVSSGDELRRYVGLLVQGKSDVDAVENHRGDKFSSRNRWASLRYLRARRDTSPLARWLRQCTSLYPGNHRQSHLRCADLRNEFTDSDLSR